MGFFNFGHDNDLKADTRVGLSMTGKTVAEGLSDDSVRYTQQILTSLNLYGSITLSELAEKTQIPEQVIKSVLEKKLLKEGTVIRL